MHPKNRLLKIAQDARSALREPKDTHPAAEIALSAILALSISPPMFRHRANPSSDTHPHPSRGSGGDSHGPPAFSTAFHTL
jgi:hypothetical protein